MCREMCCCCVVPTRDPTSILLTQPPCYMNKNQHVLLAFLLLLLGPAGFAQTTLRIEDAATFSSGFCAFEGARQNSYTGASGGYYINLQNSGAKGINWKVNAPAAGTYTLAWRYANAGSGSATTGKVLVNGVTAVASASFPKTSSWTTWTTTSVTVSLASGINTVRLETIASSEFANIDWIEVTGNSPTAASCTGTPPPVTNYTLSTGNSPLAGGTVSGNPAGSSFTSGTTVTLTATPAAGYTFTGWSGSATGTANPITITMDANKTLTANYAAQAPTQYSLSVTTSGSGTVSGNPAGGTYTAGTVVTLTATPASGYSFSGWSGALSGSANPATITMDASKSVSAVFTQNTGGGTADLSMIGYATGNGGTTGGTGGPSIVVSTLAELQAWALTRENNTTPEVLYINGKITSSQTVLVTIKHGANISIYGLGSTAELQNVGLNIRNYDNVIVRNLKIHEVFYPNDALTLDDVVNGWVDHCEFYSKIGAGIGVDTYDGLLDIKNGSRYITVSWNYLHHHMKNMLFGHTDNSSQAAIDAPMRITLHHNFIESTDGRNPSLRYGAVHMFNNYFRNITDYGVAVRQGAHALIQNNVYENVKLPITTNKFDGEGFACESGNIFSNSGANSITQTGCDFWSSSQLPYAFSLDPASDITTLLPPNVGVGKVDVGTPPATRAVRPVAEAKGAESLELYPSFPNPARGTTIFRFYLPSASKARISVYDAAGKQVAVVADRKFEAGAQQLPYSLGRLGAGFYIYELATEGGTIRKTLVVR
ncbi:MAG: carbohydrate-binding protein [Chitinophagaceae bacterium]|nr:MAG: carbohydrate-binding protein [Chitinophagaceae bacterium]